jgi:hypothetical protein
MEKFEVPNLDDPTETYLTRWRIIQTPLFAIYLHRFDGPDSRATLHDHPWNFVSIVLRGGYCERRRYDGPLVRIDRLNVKRAEDTHYIEHLHRTPSWTLMLVGRRRREWGYWDRDGTWTHFERHRHGAEFDAAMAAREADR